MFSFLDMPVDVLYMVLYELSVEDLFSISVTCKYLSDLANDRSVWTKRINEIQTRLPFLARDRPNLERSSAEELKLEAIRQSILDHRWSTRASEPGKVRKLNCGNTINFFTLFPGGEWLVVISYDGQFCIKEVAPLNGAAPRSATMSFSPQNVRDIMHNFWALRSPDGSAVLSMSQASGSHSRMHFYRVSPQTMAIQYLGNKILPLCRWASPVRSYPKEENMIACLHLGNMPGAMQLTLLLLPPSASVVPFTCKTKATFDLGRFASFTGVGTEMELFSICIPYTHILIVTHGSTRVRIFELPPLETLNEGEQASTISVPVIWEWNAEYRPPMDFEATLLIPHIPCRRSYLDNCWRRRVYIVAEDSLDLHCLTISVSEQGSQNKPNRTTIEHDIFSRVRARVVGNSYLALRSHRGAWLTRDPIYNLITFETISFRYIDVKNIDSDKDEYPLPIGSFSVDTSEFGNYLLDWDFDEVSGRFCLLILDPASSSREVVLVDRAANNSNNPISKGSRQNLMSIDRMLNQEDGVEPVLHI